MYHESHTGLKCQYICLISIKESDIESNKKNRNLDQGRKAANRARHSQSPVSSAESPGKTV